jgi:CBS domain-containing protein
MRQWTVDDVMTTDVVAVPERAQYRAIVNLLAERRVSAVPVVDADGHIVGVVSEADLLHKIELAGDPDERHLFERRARRSARAKAHGDTAAELMTSPAITVESDTPLAAAARIMDSERVKRLPVTDRSGRLVGIVARSDLLKTHLRPDPDIRAEIVAEVIDGVLWADPIAVEVDVDDGVVTLRGTVDRHTTARIAVHLSAAVPGVVDVVDQLAWDFDDIAVKQSASAHERLS